MPSLVSPPAAVTATRRVASLLNHLGVSPYAFDDTIGLINPLLTVHQLHARVIGKQQETPTATTLVLQAGPAFTGFVPGQYLMIGVEINGVRLRRAYSPRSVEGKVDQFAITVQRQVGGKVSNHIADHTQVGDIIEIETPGGDFVLPEPAPANVLMIAGGSGITPCMSMLEELQRRNGGTQVTLIYFARSQQDRIFAKALESLAASWKSLKYVPLDSTAHTAESSTLATTAAANPAQQQSTLTADVLAQHAPGWQACTAYCCGPAPLMDAARALWSQAGLSQQLRLEAFAPVRPSGDPSIQHQVSFTREGKTLNFTATAAETVLISGEQAGHALKHGCRQGICHECTCRLSSGAILDLTTGEQIRGEGQVVRICVSAALSDLQLESLS